MTALDSLEMSRRVRTHALRMVHRVDASHIGACLSMADTLGVLYSGLLRVRPQEPSWPDRDRMIISKGHAAAAVYAVLAAAGFFPASWLDGYCATDSPLTGHVSSRHVPGVEVSTGSLGHGLPIACGMGLATRHDSRPSRVFVLLSDGELDEGSNWEAILFAAHHRLANLTAIVDYNKLQGFGRVEDVVGLEPLADKWRAFGWCVREVDGHDHDTLRETLSAVPFAPEKPSVVIAHTIKGKGVSYMEDQLAWHYRSPNAKQLERGLGELEQNG